MKLQIITVSLIASQANANFLRNMQMCPMPGTGVACPLNIEPVVCGNRYQCEYDNACLANAAGFVKCLPIEPLCPKPGTRAKCRKYKDR